MMVAKEGDENIVLFVSTYPPRECGIATFTQDLTEAIDKRFFPTIKTKILALNNPETLDLEYPKNVMYAVEEYDVNKYMQTAQRINEDPRIKLVCVQHEFGIFGGDYGDHLLPFLEILDKPVIVTFHSVLPHPDRQRRIIVRAIAERTKAFVVMTEKAVSILQKEYGVTTPIVVIPHGIPEVQYKSQEKDKKDLGLEGRIVLASFGMISQNKGYEFVIRSLPKVVKNFPNVLYLIIGETHPVVREREGEKYREMLQKIVKDLKLEKNVEFRNKYHTKSEIIKYLRASDIYVSPSLTPEQITSGTLVYGMGCGRVTVSTPFLHARDIVTPERGRLVKSRKPRTFAAAINRLLAEPEKLKKMERNTYSYTRQMLWQNVGISYGKLFNKYINLPEIHFRDKIPAINMNHIRKLTDDFGILRTATFATPDITSGYTLDDNSRALLVCGALYNKQRRNNQIKLMKIYLDFMKYVQQKDGRMLNVVQSDFRIDPESWSEEAHGRAIRALGYILTISGLPRELRKQAEKTLTHALKPVSTLQYPRAIASTIAGLHFSNQSKYSEQNIDLMKQMADRLLVMYQQNSKENWNWFEPVMTYSNGKLPEALLYAYITTQDKKYAETAKEALDFLIEKTFHGQTFAPVGQKGWFDGTKKAVFDQHPVEATSMTNSLILAHRIFKKQKYERFAISAFNWFLGKNIRNTVMYNETTGGSFDRLGKKTINSNQGAEATLAYLLARVHLEELI